MLFDEFKIKNIMTKERIKQEVVASVVMASFIVLVVATVYYSMT